MSCEHKRTFTIYACHADRFTYHFDNGDWSSPNYAPDIEGLCGGDDTNVTVCLDCKVVVGLSVEDIEALIPEPDEWED